MPLSRRTLILAGCAAAGCGLPSVEQLPATIPAGNISGLPQGTLRALPGVPVAIARDAGGIYAMTLICTHQGCDMSGGVGPSFIDCGCHGSVFDAHGNPLRGPATLQLQHFVVDADASGALTVHTDQPTPASTRLPA